MTAIGTCLRCLLTRSRTVRMNIGLRFGAEADPAVVVVRHVVRIDAVLRFERVDVRRFVAAVGDAVGVGLRVVADVAGADPVEEQAVDVVVREQLVEERELVGAHFGEREAELRVVRLCRRGGPSGTRGGLW